ncbi:MAG: sulfurtransferase [Acidimicrobiales bacterium]
MSPEWLEAHRARSCCATFVRTSTAESARRLPRRHLPGARFVDLDTVLAAPAAPVVGRHPMPTPEVFANGLANEGIGDDTTVVAYDDAGGMIAGRLVWMLRILGQDAALLDGGIGAWTAANGADQLETGAADAAIAAERAIVSWPDGVMVDADEVAAHIANGGVVVDSRAGERFRGEVEPIDPKAGHVPGALNLPFAANLDGPLDGGRFRPPGELAARFTEAGVDDQAIIYCGSGVSACNNILAAELAGVGRPRLYVGSWSGWSSDPDREVATGDEAADEA